nr:hypothetical protein CFP56_69043 [Quercus suber]
MTSMTLSSIIGATFRRCRTVEAKRRRHRVSGHTGETLLHADECDMEKRRWIMLKCHLISDLQGSMNAEKDGIFDSSDVLSGTPRCIVTLLPYDISRPSIVCCEA